MRIRLSIACALVGGLLVSPVNSWSRGAKTLCRKILDLGKLKPEKTEHWMVGRKARVRGWYRPGEYLLEEKGLKGKAGYLRIKPFGFVREKNPSLGGPSWYALDVVMVNTGWISEKAAKKRPEKRKWIDPLFVESTIIQGVIKPVSRQVDKIRHYFEKLPSRTKLPPTGYRVLPVFMDLSRKSAASPLKPCPPSR